DAGGGYRFRIERSKIDHNGSIILRSGDCEGQGSCLTSSVFIKPCLDKSHCMDRCIII
ncbi:unnamed protein product, partial [Larinioides sclopetarius]